MEIKVLQGSKRIQQINTNVAKQKEIALFWSLANTTAPARNNENLLTIPSPMLLSLILANSNLIPISLKGENQESIALSHNLVFHTRSTYIDIQYHYIRNKMASDRIDL